MAEYKPIDEVVVGPFRVSPRAPGSRDVIISYHAQSQVIDVDKVDIPDLIKALKIVQGTWPVS